MLPGILAFAPAVALLVLRLAIASLFLTSGWLHLMDPTGRGASIGLSPAATVVLGAAELVGGGLVAAGFFTGVGALFLMAIMVGALWFKEVPWKTGLLGESGTGRHYELLLLSANGIIFAVGPGAVSLDALILSLAM